MHKRKAARKAEEGFRRMDEEDPYGARRGQLPLTRELQVRAPLGCICSCVRACMHACTCTCYCARTRTVQLFRRPSQSFYSRLEVATCTVECTIILDAWQAECVVRLLVARTLDLKCSREENGNLQHSTAIVHVRPPHMHT